MSTDSWLTAAIGFGAGLVASLLVDYFRSRINSDGEIRAHREKNYPELWSITDIAPVFGTVPIAPLTLDSKVVELRTWYYGSGGMYLSSTSSEAFSHLQSVLVHSAMTAAVSSSGQNAGVSPGSTEYADIRVSCSVLRQSLARDLSSRSRYPWTLWVLRRDYKHAASWVAKAVRVDGRQD